ncbi:hypothetical protein SNE35_11140 [Paucibacter sp. R3-3]|uniref:Ribosomal protein L7/L12 C-terminal domain-containing protein n=1 Tax=Roseateles agri TaxID=3098619 RepID=A0ABU5DH51_9BURK|nr:hypothetical protein [Paucibacter sp. R3-3]MDY0745068.1 hypothetical protein [Paucibacter sp. R3-3]
MQFETFALVAIALLLVELLRRLASLEVNVKQLLAMQGAGPNRSLEPSEEVLKLARAGQDIDAMRLYRQESGADVKQAMKLVDDVRSASAKTDKT